MIKQTTFFTFIFFSFSLQGMENGISRQDLNAIKHNLIQLGNSLIATHQQFRQDPTANLAKYQQFDLFKKKYSNYIRQIIKAHGENVLLHLDFEARIHAWRILHFCDPSQDWKDGHEKC